MSNAGSLLTAADKYNIPRLKHTAEEFLCQNIDINNVDKILVLTYLHEAKQLQVITIFSRKRHLNS